MLENIHSPADLKALSFEQLENLAKEIREKIITVVGRNGGHLASNLGTVEATLAMHRVFDSPHDRIIWDVGHQSYTHKLLTGRLAEFDTLRKFNGLSGFPKRAESVHDVFETGHSSTSISAALGMARARDLQGGSYDVVAFIGDGSLTGGMAFEAINDAGHAGTRLIIIVNDNEMSIARNVGAISEILSRIRSKRQYYKIKHYVQKSLRKIPRIGEGLVNLLERLKNTVKYFFVKGVFFEELGLAYIGPIDGHDLHSLTVSLKQAKQFDKPVVVHISTRKGRGHKEAEKNPERFHSVPEDTCQPNGKSKYAKILGAELTRMACQQKNIVAITAAMTEGCGLECFRSSFPERFFDVGIAEQHAVTMAAGLAIEGLRPVFAVYSTFLQRAYDQILHDVCRQNLNVVFAISHSGLVGEDGETHQGIFVLSYLLHIPRLRVFYPADGYELAEMLKLALTLQGPTAICFPKGTPTLELEPLPLVNGKWHTIVKREKPAAVLLAVGEHMLKLAMEASEEAKRLGLAADVVNCSFLKPLDEDFLLHNLHDYSIAMTMEENELAGGFGSYLLSRLSNEGRLNGTRMLSLGFNDRYVPHGSIGELLAAEGFTPALVAQKLLDEAAKR
jgi:1-deoxy-D-xylulose-5-phosphate synthase